MSNTSRNCVIIGGGPAGLTAGLYLGRAGEKPLLLEKMFPGGQLATTTEIENYPGFSQPVESHKLIEEMVAQAERFGLELLTGEEVIGVSKKDNLFEITAASGRIEKSKTVIIATGARPKLLGVPGESELTGRGVSYCAVCDGALYKGAEVAVIGGGDSALTEALFLTRFASSVTIIHRRDKFRGVKTLADRVFSNEKIKILWNTRVKEIIGKHSVEKLLLESTAEREKIFELQVEGVFIFVGYTPNTSFLASTALTCEDSEKNLNGGRDLKWILDEEGYIITDEQMRTRIPGLFACGDVRRKTLKQVVTATSDGAVAATGVVHFLESL